MTEFEKIKNQELRELMKNSPSVQSLSEDLQAGLVEQIAGLPEEAADGLIKIFKEEKGSFDQLRAEDEKQVAKYQALIEEMAAAGKKVEKDVLVERENVSSKEEEKQQQELLKKME